MGPHGEAAPQEAVQVAGKGLDRRVPGSTQLVGKPAFLACLQANEDACKEIDRVVVRQEWADVTPAELQDSEVFLM